MQIALKIYLWHKSLYIATIFLATDNDLNGIEKADDYEEIFFILVKTRAIKCIFV